MAASGLIAYGIAIAIPILAIYLIYALDLFGTGKVGTVAVCMAWGATFAFGLAYLLNNFALQFLIDNADMSRVVARNTVIAVIAPLVEEILKSLILIYFIQSPRFRYVVDGAIYGFGVGIGFAVVENLFYLSNSNADLTLAISRVLSTSLMHATASGMVGISLGRLRRANRTSAVLWQIAGIIAALAIHMGYNRVVNSPNLTGITLLLFAIGLGIGGSVIIGFLINLGIKDEKRSFDETLTMDVDVSEGERKTIQRLGGGTLERTMEDLSTTFGEQNINLVRRLLVKQANIGILQNNLASTNVSDRLREAWEREIDELQEEVTETRKQLGMYVSAYLQSMFPADDLGLWNTINEEVAATDPTLVHTFDMFMRVSQMAENFTADQLEAMAERLHKISIFKYISLADLENLSRAISVVTFENGSMLFDKGDEGDAMYMIENGQINIYTLDHAGQEKVLRTFNPGDVVGDFAVLDGQPRSARARAIGALTTLALTRQVFMMFIRRWR
jgi:RsiW-degrading membrane proteinase PrsW (M82 family)